MQEIIARIIAFFTAIFAFLGVSGPVIVQE